MLEQAADAFYGRTRALVTEYNALEPEAYCCCRHSLHAIAAQLSPAPGCTGIELLQADTFDLHCFQTLTGTKMLMVVEPNTPDVDILLRDTCGTAPGTIRLGLLTCIFTARVLTCGECAITEISLTLVIAACAVFSCTSSAANALAGSCQQPSL